MRVHSESRPATAEMDTEKAKERKKAALQHYRKKFDTIDGLFVLLMLKPADVTKLSRFFPHEEQWMALEAFEETRFGLRLQHCLD